LTCHDDQKHANEKTSEHGHDRASRTPSTSNCHVDIGCDGARDRADRCACLAADAFVRCRAVAAKCAAYAVDGARRSSDTRRFFAATESAACGESTAAGGAEHAGYWIKLAATNCAGAGGQHGDAVYRAATRALAVHATNVAPRRGAGLPNAFAATGK
jgi:hypothetical protein